METRPNLRQDGRGIQAGEGGRERFEVEGRLGQLPLGGGSAAPLNVQLAHGYLDEGVVEEPQGVRVFTPQVLQRFMGFPVTACAEQLEARLQSRGEGGIFRVLRQAVALKAFEPEDVLSRARKSHGVTN